MDEVFAAGHRIDVLPGPVQATARLPRRRAGQREHVVHDVPSVGRRGALRVRRHRTQRRQRGEAEPQLLGVAAAGERRRSREVTRDDRILLGVALGLTLATVGAVAAVAAEIGVHRAAADEAARVGSHPRWDAYRPRRGASECGRQGLDVADDLPNLVGVE